MCTVLHGNNSANEIDEEVWNKLLFIGIYTIASNHTLCNFNSYQLII
jgi:hypothetical protein